jgi:hypothetical protein
MENDKDVALLGTAATGDTDNKSTPHILGEWKTIRVGGITVAGGYECACGVIGCGRGVQAASASTSAVQDGQTQSER